MVSIRIVDEKEEKIILKPPAPIFVVQKCPKCKKRTKFQILHFIEKGDILDKVWGRIRCTECGYETTRLLREDLLEEIEYEKIRERMIRSVKK